MRDDAISRRTFAARAALLGAGLTIVPRDVLGGVGHRAPSDVLDVACIGVGGIGQTDVKGVAGENVVALCDVDARALERAGTLHPRARRYRDWRELLAREKSVDGVTVSTPDHTHAVIALAALRAGKHVYCQKPLARTIGEVRALATESARRPRQATQMGNQGHAGEGTRQIRELVEAGAIGTVRRVEFWTDRPIWPQALDRPTEQHVVPPWLDWDLWLGPAEARPYHPAYAPFRWRGWWDFGTGALGDMACHIMDAAYWTLGLRWPTRVTPELTQTFAETAPRASRLTFDFPAAGARPAVQLVWREGGMAPPRPFDWPEATPWPFDGSGQLWVGDVGTLVAGTYGDAPRLSDPARQAAIEASRPAVRYPRVAGAYAEWIDAAKQGTQPGSSFAPYAGPFTEMVLLGVLAQRMARDLVLDPATGRVTNVAVPDALVRPAARAGWTIA